MNAREVKKKIYNSRNYKRPIALKIENAKAALSTIVEIIKGL